MGSIPARRTRIASNMRVLFVNPISALGGAEWSLLELARALRRRNVEVMAAVPAGPLQERLKEVGIDCQPLPSIRLTRPRVGRPEGIVDWLKLPAMGRSLAQIVRRQRPDVLHLNAIAPVLALTLTKVRTPALWHVRDLTLTPACVRLASRRVRALVAISSPVMQRLAEILPGTSRHKARLIVNGIDLTRFDNLPTRDEARRRLSLPAGVPLAGMLAHLVPWKRHDLFIDAARATLSRLPEAHFVLAGTDLLGEHSAYLHSLRETAERKKLDGRLHWLTDGVDAAIYLRALDLLVHPSAMEPFGRCLCEAMAAGTPVLTTRSAGPQTIVRHDTSGWLVPPNDRNALAQGMIRLLDEPEERGRLAGAARQQVRQEFDIQRVADEVLALYVEAVG